MFLRRHRYSFTVASRAPSWKRIFTLSPAWRETALETIAPARVTTEYPRRRIEFGFNAASRRSRERTRSWVNVDWWETDRASDLRRSSRCWEWVRSISRGRLKA